MSKTFVARVHLVEVADDTGEITELTDMTINGRELPALSKRVAELLALSAEEPMHYPVDAPTEMDKGRRVCSCGQPLSLCEEWMK